MDLSGPPPFNQASGLPLETSIFIVGASVFGLSSAYHLALSGYKNITVFDRADSIPSPYAASNDLNKIIRAEYGVGHGTDDFYTELALEAIEAWSSPEWASCFRKTGYIRLARDKTKQEAIKRDVEYFSRPRPQEKDSRRWFPSDAFQALSTPQDIQRIVPQLADVKMPAEWGGALNKHAGYALASKAVCLLHQRCTELGVKFSLGADGHITQLLVNSSSENRVSGMQSSNGNQHFHPPSEPGLTILALGAELPMVLSEAKTQVTAKAWSVAHLELTSAEAELLKDAPVVSLSELGFWIESVLIVPEADETQRGGKLTVETEQRNYLLKFAAHGGGWTNTVQGTSNEEADPLSHDREQGPKPPGSLPPDEPIRAIPASDEQLLRELIRLTLPPFLYDRQFVKKSMCWCADTASSDFLIDFVPGYQGLLIAGADSGHAFKFLPIVGKWVVDVIKSGGQREERWRWKPSGNRSDVGESVVWRGGSVRALEGEVLT